MSKVQLFFVSSLFLTVPLQEEEKAGTPPSSLDEQKTKKKEEKLPTT
jgi:hypothetical protein